MSCLLPGLQADFERQADPNDKEQQVRYYISKGYWYLARIHYGILPGFQWSSFGALLGSTDLYLQYAGYILQHTVHLHFASSKLQPNLLSASRLTRATACARTIVQSYSAALHSFSIFMICNHHQYDCSSPRYMRALI